MRPAGGPTLSAPTSIVVTLDAVATALPSGQESKFLFCFCRDAESRPTGAHRQVKASALSGPAGRGL
jgi:hypothetical protein